VTPTLCSTTNIIFTIYDNTTFKCYSTKFDPDTVFQQWKEVDSIVNMQCGAPNLEARLIKRGHSRVYQQVGNGQLGFSVAQVDEAFGVYVVAEEASRVMSFILGAAPRYPILKTGLTYMLGRDGNIASAGTPKVLRTLLTPSTVEFEDSRIAPNDTGNRLIADSAKKLTEQYSDYGGLFNASDATVHGSAIIVSPSVAIYGSVDYPYYIYAKKFADNHDYSLTQSLSADGSTYQYLSPDILFVTVIPVSEYMGWATTLSFYTFGVWFVLAGLFAMIFWTSVWLVTNDFDDLATAITRARMSWMTKAMVTVVVWLFSCVVWEHYGETQLDEIVKLDMFNRAAGIQSVVTDIFSRMTMQLNTMYFLHRFKYLYLNLEPWNTDNDNQIFRSVASRCSETDAVYFGGSQGGYHWYEKKRNYMWDRASANTCVKGYAYPVTAVHQSPTTNKQFCNYDPRYRTWYQEAQGGKTMTFSKPYIFLGGHTNGEVGISASLPIYTTHVHIW